MERQLRACPQQQGAGEHAVEEVDREGEQDLVPDPDQRGAGFCNALQTSAIEGGKVRVFNTIRLVSRYSVPQYDQSLLEDRQLRYIS